MSTIRNLIAGLVLLVMTIAAPAAVLLEFDYQNVDNGAHQTTAIQTRSGASPIGQLGTNLTLQYATVNTGPALGGGPILPQLQNGYLELLGRDGRGLSMAPSAGSNNEWQDYMGAANRGTSTVELVYQPNANGSLAAVRTFFSYQVASGDEVFLFINADFNPDAITLRFNASATYWATVNEPSWKSNAWYYIAASWAVGQNATVYWRELKGTNGMFDSAGFGNFGSATQAVPQASNFTGDPHIGVWGHAFASFDSENALGRIAWFRWSDGFASSEAAFDQLFDDLFIPEPGTFFLMACGGAVIATARRRLLKQTQSR